MRYQTQLISFTRNCILSGRLVKLKLTHGILSRQLSVPYFPPACFGIPTLACLLSSNSHSTRPWRRVTSSPQPPWQSPFSNPGVSPAAGLEPARKGRVLEGVLAVGKLGWWEHLAATSSVVPYQLLWRQPRFRDQKKVVLVLFFFFKSISFQI